MAEEQSVSSVLPIFIIRQPKDEGIGTSMINFANSLSAAFYSPIYGACPASGVTDVVLCLTKIRPVPEEDSETVSIL